MIKVNTIFVLIFIFLGCENPKSPDNVISGDRSLIKANAVVANANLLKKKFREADTVLLISHTGREYKHKQEYESASVPPILINGKLNTHILKTQIIVSDNELDTLIKILVRPVKKDDGRTKCIFDPHHAIVIVKGGIFSYVDFCVQCRQFETSKDLNLLLNYDGEKWEDLELYFKRMGFKFLR